MSKIPIHTFPKNSYSIVTRLGGNEISYMNELKKNDLYTKISRTGDIDVNTVKDVFRLAEIIVLKHLSSVTPDKDAKVYLMDGLNISSKLIENYETENVRTKEKITIPKKIKVTPKITQWYKDKVNNR